MNRDFLKERYEAAKSKLGGFGEMLSMAVGQIVVPMKAGDIEGTRARAYELKEAAAEMDQFADNLIADLADNELDAGELASRLNEAAGVIDELEDVATGNDEDDVVPE